MERMEKRTDFYDFIDKIQRQDRYIAELEEENKKLEDKIKRLEFDVDAWHQLKLLLEWEIKKLAEENDALLREKATLREYCDELDSECDDLVVTKELLEWQLRELTKENKKLKETIKDHQFYEEKLEHRIIEFEELLHWE